MADPLYEILNRVQGDPQTASPPVVQQAPQVPWQQKLVGALTGIMQMNPMMALPMRAKEIYDGTFVENERMRVGQMSRVPTDVIGGIIGLPNLPDTVTQLVSDKKLGRIDALDTAAEAVHGAGQSVGETIAGRPLNDSLLEGTPAELGASWQRLFAGAAIPLPGSWQAKMSSALQKVSAGNAAADTIAKGVVNTMEMLTPLTLNPKNAALNVGIASTLAPALELAVANHEQAKEAVQTGSEQAKGALDVAGEGATEARNANAVKASMLPSITGDDTTDAVIGASLLGAATFAQAKFNVAGRVLAGTKKALTSYDPNNPMDHTNASTWDLILQQNQNRNQTPETAFRKVLESQGAKNIDERVTAIKESNAMRSGASVDTRMKSVINDGDLLDSVHKIAPINDFYTRWAQLTPDLQQPLLDQAIIAMREIDTRRILKTLHDLPNTTTKDLQAIVDTAKADPQVKQLMDDYFATNRVFSSYMDEQKRFSSAEIKMLVKANPNFAATQLAEGARWLDDRGVVRLKHGRGLETMEELGSPVQLWPQYIDEVFRSTEGMKIRRDWFTEMMHAKGKADPYARNMIGRTLDDPPPNNSADRFVYWRDARGNAKWTEVMDAAVRNSLNEATNPSALQLHKGLGAATRWYESGAVGTAAAVTGSVFAPKSALYARTFGTVFRPEGIAASPLDKFVQTISGHKFGAPEPFTAMPMDLWNAFMGIGAVLTQRGAMALHNSVVRQGAFAKTLDAILPNVPIGPNTAKAAADGLATLYKRTGAYELQQRGLLGPGTFASVDPALSYKEAEKVLRGHGLIGALRETGSFVGDILHGITTAPALTALQLNKGADKAKVSSAIRNMSGDPSAAGAFRKSEMAAKTVNTIPWGNIFLQSGFRMIEGFKKNPAGAVGGIMTTAVMPEILSGMWNAAQGPEYVDYQYNVRSPDQQASSVYIAIPGRLPAEGVEVPIDPWLRPFKHMGGLLNASYLGLLDGSLFRPDNAMQLKAIKDAVRHRQMGFGQGTVPSALIAQTIVPPVPGIVSGGVSALTGQQMRSWDDVRPISDKRTGGFTEGTGPQGNMFMDKYGPAWLDDIMRGIGAQAGANVYTMLNDTLTRRFSGDMGRNEGNQKLVESYWPPKAGEAIKQGVVANVEQKLKDSGRMFGTGSLFDNLLAISPGVEASGVLVSDKLKGLQKLSDAFASATLPGGTAQTVVGDKKRGYQEYMGAAPLGGVDPVMDTLGREAARISRELNSAYGGMKKDLYDQRQSISNSSRYSPQMKRYMMNEVADQIIQMDRKMLVDIERHEAVISQQLGIPVKFDGINLNKGAKQFK